MKQVPGWPWIVIAAIFVFSMLMMSQVVRPPVETTIAYSEFKKMVSDGEVAEVTLTGESVTAVLKSPSIIGTQKDSTKDLQTVLPSSGDPDLLRLFEEQGVVVWNHPVETGSNWFLTLLPWIIFIGVYLYIMRRMQGNLMDRFGGRNSSDFLMGSAAKEEKAGRRVTFDDVAGQEQAKKEVAELVEFLKHPEDFKKLGADPPRGVLLVGPPGTGKTLLARALAGEAGVNFFNISASEFIEMFVGVGASRVRKMFDEAKKRAPSIIFIDELDAVGRVRGTGLGGGNDEREQTLNQILSEMDGFSGRETVIVLAATNRPDVLDPALLRPGRFDRHVTLELPDKSARKAILEVHTRKVPLAKDVDLDLVSAGCPGFSGADIKNLVNEAAIAAVRERVAEVSMHHFDEMRDRIIMGTVRTLAIQPEEQHRLAVHEAGHTAVAYFLPHADPLYKVTIIPRGRALGGTHLLPTEERHTLDEEYLRDRLAVSLAGRGAEEFFLGSVSSGADDDIKNATKLARAMVSQWGMSDEVGPIDLRQSEDHPFLGREIAQPRRFSEEMSSRVDDAVLKLIREAEERGLEILKAHKTQIEQLIEKLEKDETVNWPEIDTILGPKTAKEGIA
ncbi:ATP-dependent zinc metalloprotease FtsH [Sneathiella litorea]|uniref:ATP-dependent zinc metalloprotease FtsH n=1 Tax=Sneathiella litorea TaxID=2606216 RepID=A0A6L8W4U7_9PROT|nr:ATP-dependent zinc metalloprotease FtsH [Sneathiella litorea]MZR30078.1 ATP-dependent zinc metalloprotease FtsH [Sneathiella litorea]